MSAPQADDLDLRLLRFRKSPTVAEGLSLAEALVAASRERDALSVYDLLRRGAPRDASLPHRAGRVLLRLGDLQAAQAVLLEAIQIAPEDASIAVSLGEVLLKRGEPVRAKELLARHLGAPGVDSLYARAERLARLSAAVEVEAPLPEERTTTPSGERTTTPTEERTTTPSEDRVTLTAPVEDRVTAPAPEGPSADDAAGFFEDVPTAMIEREQLDALRAERASRAEDAAPPPSPPIEVELEIPSKRDEDATREVDVAALIPMPEPSTRTWTDRVTLEPEEIEAEPVPSAPRKKGRAWIAALAVLAVALAAGAYVARDFLLPQGSKGADALVAEADRLFREGDPATLDEAVAQLDAAAAASPTGAIDASVEAFGRALALLELERGDASKARLAAERAEGPLREAALAAVGFATTREAPAPTSLALPSKAFDPRVSLLLGRLRQAAGGDPTVDFELALRDDASSVPAAHVELALVHLSRGEQARALAALEGARGARAALVRRLADPTRDADVESPAPFDRFLGGLARAHALVHEGRLDEAREALASLEVSVARGPLGPMLFARAAHRAGDEERAREALAKALELGEGDRARAFAAEIALEAGDFDRAREVLAELDGEAAVRVAVAIARRTASRSDLSEAREAIAAAELDEARAAAYRAVLALVEGAPDAELDALAERIGDADEAWAILARAEIELLRERFDRALELAERAAEAEPENVDAARIRGLSAFALGDVDRAASALAVAAEHGDPLASLRLAEIRLDEGDAAAAAKLLPRERVDALPETERLGAHRLRARALAEAGDLGGAREALTALEGIEDEETLAIRAEVARRAGDLQPLVAWLAPRLDPLIAKGKASPEDAPLLVTYADALEALGDPKRAGSAYQLAVRTEPTSIEARIGYARALIRGRKEAQALRVLDRADLVLEERGELDRRPTELLLLRGRALLELGKRAEAAAFLQEATERDDAPAEAFFYLGESLAGRKVAESRAAYERYLSLEPEGPHAKRAERAIQR